MLILFFEIVYISMDLKQTHGRIKSNKNKPRNECSFLEIRIISVNHLFQF